MYSHAGKRRRSELADNSSSDSSSSDDSIDSSDDEADVRRKRLQDQKQEEELEKKRRWSMKEQGLQQVDQDLHGQEQKQNKPNENSPDHDEAAAAAETDASGERKLEKQKQEQENKTKHEQNKEASPFNQFQWEEGSEGSIEVTDGMYAICCTVCTCNDEDVARYFYTKHHCGNSGSNQVEGNHQMFHRGCCHKIKAVTMNSLTPMAAAIEEGRKMEGRRKVQAAKPISHLLSRYKRAKVLESQFHNSQFDTAKDSELYTNEKYTEFAKEFNKRLNGPKLDSLRVLDLFSGIGSGIAVLKKMGIPLSKIVSVEHDPVAKYVYKYHHDDGSSSDKDGDATDVIHISKYEDVCSDEDIKNLIRQHGPFDLLLAGAPCTNYSKVNGYRKKNSKKEDINYLSDVGRLIKKIDEIQKLNDPNRFSLLFLSENVNFEQSRVDEVSKSYGVPPVRLDAKDFGPTKRDRLYWTNILLSKAESLTDVASEQSACKLLDHGYIMTETVCKQAEGDEDVMIPKANTFMASKVRINDDRMIKVQQKGDKWIIEPYSVKEREVMSGLPCNYVRNPVKKLFEELSLNGFINPEDAEGTNWRTFLPEELHHFQYCKFKVKPKEDAPFFELEISSPTEGKVVSLYDEQEYCKHLIGNGWSLPVIEYLLSGVKNLCKSASYEGYDYCYPWPPYNLDADESHDWADV